MTDGADAALIGRTIAGKFVIEKYLGGGAMGAVYRARQSALDKNIAVKVMHRAIAGDPAFARRFHREAKAASRLDHPNSLRVIDFGEEPDGLLYIAMEYLEGRDLYRVLKEDWPLSPARIADILMQALAALAVAHDMGVIHRDLKPENIMVLKGKDDEGEPVDVIKVCDFGIAKISERENEVATDVDAVWRKLTTQGLVVGTPEYMSPEQAQGEKLDARSDLYSIGVILYQLLTGRVPFEGGTALAVVLKHLSDAAAPPHTICPDVHKGLEAVCLKALEKERTARYQDAREMRADFRAAIAGEPLGRAVASDELAPTVAVPAVSTPPSMHESPAGPTSGPKTPLGAAAAPSEPPKKRGASVGLLLSGVALVAAVAGIGVYRASRMMKADGKDQTSAAATSIGTLVRVVESASLPTSTVVSPPGSPDLAPPRSAPPAPWSGPPRANAAPHVPRTRAASDDSAPAPEPPPPAPPSAAPPPPPPAFPAAPPPVSEPKPFSATACRAKVGPPHANGAVNGKDLKLGNVQDAWTACFRQATTSAPAGPASATVAVQFSDAGRFQGATCTGCPAAAAACVRARANAMQLAIKGGDITGEPSFDVPVTFACE